MTFATPLKWPDGWPRSRSHEGPAGGWRDLGWDRIVRDLYDELLRLHAQTGSVVITTNMPLNMNGTPNRREAFSDHGVAAYFMRRGKKVAMARDAYNNVLWNLRSLTKAMEYLRGLERHGGAAMMDRAFEGFTALPPPAGSVAGRPWREVLGMVGVSVDPPIMIAMAEASYRTMAKGAAGSDDLLRELNLAIEGARLEIKGTVK